MHAEIATRRSFWCSDARAGGPPPGNSFLQAACAVSNDGANGLTAAASMEGALAARVGIGVVIARNGRRRL
jgi:hypothetical protein